MLIFPTSEVLLVEKVSEFPLEKMPRLQGASAFRRNSAMKTGAQGLVGRTPHNTMRIAFYQREMLGDEAAWKRFFKRLLRRGVRLQKAKMYFYCLCD